MGVFLSYLRHRRIIWLPLPFAAIFGILSWLSGVSVGTVFYALLLCGLLTLFAGSLDYYSYWKRQKTIRELLDRVAVSLDQVPDDGDAVEYAYRELLRAVFAEKARAESVISARLADNTEYFTLWAHQIKTPIAAMRLLLQTGEEKRELSEELFRIEQYVEMALSYQRLNSETSDLLLRHVQLDAVVRASLRKFAPLFIRKKIHLHYDGVEDIVLTDDKWLQFVIEQLLANALKYTPEGGSIEICTDGEKTLVIRDTGIGISPEDVPRVFEKGYTGYNGRTDKKSTGLGLYLCRRVCTKLGHGIHLVSEPGQGTSVFLYLAEANTIIE